jgi:hypothetical protein
VSAARRLERESATGGSGEGLAEEGITNGLRSKNNYRSLTSVKRHAVALLTSRHTDTGTDLRSTWPKTRTQHTRARPTHTYIHVDIHRRQTPRLTANTHTHITQTYTHPHPHPHTHTHPHIHTPTSTHTPITRTYTHRHTRHTKCTTRERLTERPNTTADDRRACVEFIFHINSVGIPLTPLASLSASPSLPLSLSLSFCLSGYHLWYDEREL